MHDHKHASLSQIRVESERGTEVAARFRQVRVVLWVVLVLNLLVAVAKIVVGFLTHSAAMQADGFHSLFDGASNVLGLVGLHFAAAPPDEGHPYGHGKFESFASALIGAMLAIAGYSVGRSAIDGLLGRGVETEVGVVSFAVMIGTLIVNVIVTTWEHRAGKKLGSEILVADAEHTLSDVLVSIGVIVSLVLVALGFKMADGIVALVVAGAIFYTAWKVLRDASRTLGDAARLPAAEVRPVACGVPGVVDCHAIRTRGLESHVYVDLHVLVHRFTTVEDGHMIAHEVESRLRDRYPQIVDVVVHIEPHRPDDDDDDDGEAPATAWEEEDHDQSR